MTTTIRKRAKSKNADPIELTPNQPLEQLLTPEQFKVITAAHYAQPVSFRIICRSFSQLNGRKMTELLGSLKLLVICTVKSLHT